MRKSLANSLNPWPGPKGIQAFAPTYAHPHTYTCMYTNVLLPLFVVRESHSLIFSVDLDFESKLR